jgi:hypothetical protein
VNGQDDDTPPARPPRTPISREAELIFDVQLAFIQLAEDCGRAAGRLDTLAGGDRADVLALLRRRLGEVKDHLAELLEGLGH